MKKTVVTFIILVFGMFSSLAQNGILLSKKESNKNKILYENTRVKVTLSNGQVLKGKFNIVDNQSISIDNQLITLDSIIKIRSNSIARQILVPVSLGIGIVFGSVAIIGAAAGGWGLLFTIILLPPAIPLIAVPLSQNNHSVVKWSYKIIKSENAQDLEINNNPNLIIEKKESKINDNNPNNIKP